MIKRLISTFILLVVAAVFCGGITGCGDDVKKEYQHEQKHESEPEMVSPGEPIVE